MITLKCPKLKDLTDEYTERQIKKYRDIVPIGIGSLF